MKRTVTIVLVLVVLALAVAACGPTTPPAPTGTATSTTPATSTAVATGSTPATASPKIGPPVATVTKYNLVKNGQTVAQVTTVMGADGSVIGKGQAGTHKVVTYMWRGKTGTMVVSFIDGKVVGKHQTGLK